MKSMKNLYYKGVLFEVEVDQDDPSWVKPYYIIIKLFHKGEDITKCFPDSIVFDMEAVLSGRINEDRYY